MKTKSSRCLTVTMIGALMLALLHASPSGAQTASLNLSFDDIIGATRPNFSGQNFNYYDKAFKAWDTVNNVFYPEVVTALQAEKPLLFRYPGGLHGNLHHFDQTIGPMSERQSQSSWDGPIFPYTGVDEFLGLVEQVPGCKAINIVNMTLNEAYRGGTPEEAAAWVAYCNATSDNTTVIGVDVFGKDWGTAGSWAAARETNGHPAPYGVEFWELGNEVNIGGWNDPTVPEIEKVHIMTAEEYVARAQDFIQEMKRIDPNIKFIVVGGAPPPDGDPITDLPSTKGGGPWTETVLTGLAGQFDHVALHLYNPVAPEMPEVPELQNDEVKYVKTAFAYAPEYHVPFLDQYKIWIQEYAPGSTMWLTEFAPYPAPDQGAAFDLLSALLQADMAFNFMDNSHVDAGQAYGFNCGGYGTIYTGDGTTAASSRTFQDVVIPAGSVVRFPRGYSVQIMGKFILNSSNGTVLTSNMNCDTESVTITVSGTPQTYTYPVLRAASALSENEEELDVFLLNKSINDVISLTITLPADSEVTSIQATELNCWNRTGIDALLQEENVPEVNVYSQTVNPPSFNGNLIQASVNPHSLTLYKISLGTAPPVPPGPATNPSPADGATDVDVNADLSWTAGSGATSHNVYFGTSNPPPFVTTQAGTTYDPGTMAEDTTYYWKIVEENAYGTTEGPVWQFRTAPKSGCGAEPIPLPAGSTGGRFLLAFLPLGVAMLMLFAWRRKASEIN
ncbi:MAG: hypothetical protein GWP08_09485 [Nitrospiraceae bacterium]|nr:hypothetical protein [Nitrospiraceae bacterium]